MLLLLLREIFIIIIFLSINIHFFLSSSAVADFKNAIYLDVLFLFFQDNPVGTGTGKYNDHQLFEAKLNHASLVPIIGLMKADDFLGDKSYSKC